jgi:hypothetical protein
MIQHVGLRSPIAFRLPGPLTRESLTAELEAVAIAFEGFEFIWHPPMKREIDGEIDDYGPMVSVLVPGTEQSPAVAEALQRFFSAMVFRYGQPVEDVTHGGMGGDDPWNPHGARAQRYYAATYVLDAPREIAVVQDEALWLALALHRHRPGADTTPTRGSGRARWLLWTTPPRTRATARLRNLGQPVPDATVFIRSDARSV